MLINEMKRIKEEIAELRSSKEFLELKKTHKEEFFSSMSYLSSAMTHINYAIEEVEKT